MTTFWASEIPIFGVFGAEVDGCNLDVNVRQPRQRPFCQRAGAAPGIQDARKLDFRRRPLEDKTCQMVVTGALDLDPG